MDKPFFSIIIPSYNRANILPKTIKSVLKQTFNNWELLIVDDGSTDNTKDVIENINDDRIRYIFQKNAERSAARNNGINNSRGEWICFLDSDDSYKENHLNNFYKEILKQKASSENPIMYVSEQENYFVKKNKKENHFSNYNKINIPHFFAKESVVPGRICVKKEILKEFKFDENIVIVEDADLWFRISCHYNVKFLNEATFVYHIHEDNSINVKFNAYLKRLNGLKLTFKKPEGHKLSSKQKREILSNCYFGIHKYYIARNELTKARFSMLKSILFYPEIRIKEKLFLFLFPNKI